MESVHIFIYSDSVRLKVFEKCDIKFSKFEQVWTLLNPTLISKQVPCAYHDPGPDLTILSIKQKIHTQFSWKHIQYMHFNWLKCMRFHFKQDLFIFYRKVRYWWRKRHFFSKLCLDVKSSNGKWNNHLQIL